MLSRGLIKDFQAIVGAAVFTAETGRHTSSYDAAVLPPVLSGH
jgi:hypothetical protein